MESVIKRNYLIVYQVVDAIVDLKKKVITDFNKYLVRLNKGYTDNYDMILHQIAFIQTYQNLDKIDGIYEYLISS